jgi:hypothetical protein
MRKKQTGMRLSDAAIFLADEMAKTMGSNRTTIIELAIRTLAQDELQRGRLKPEVIEQYEKMVGIK